MSFEEYSFIIDVDGTLCHVKKTGENYEDLVPYENMIERIRYYKKNGARIVLFTSRNMNTYKGNMGMINKHTAPALIAWLNKWDIPYDEIIFGKPWPGHKGFYVDDRTIRPDEFLEKTIEELDDICREGTMKSLEVET